MFWRTFMTRPILKIKKQKRDRPITNNVFLVVKLIWDS